MTTVNDGTNLVLTYATLNEREPFCVPTVRRMVSKKLKQI